MRWQQFELLMAGHAPMPEPGFADALYYKVAQNEAAGHAAVTWALGSTTDLRQIAHGIRLVPGRALAGAIPRARRETGQGHRAALARSFRFGHAGPRRWPPSCSPTISRSFPSANWHASIQGWWRGEIAPALQAGRNVISRDDLYPLYEMLHAVRDNLNIDLRESAVPYFKNLPIYDLVSYYPAAYPAPENEYRIPCTKGAEEPDVQPRRHGPSRRAGHGARMTPMRPKRSSCRAG